MFFCFVIFSLELIVATIFKEGYIFGFYFWLDCVATLSLLADVSWIVQNLTGSKDFSASNAQQAASLARSGRAARIGTRAARIARVIRLARLIRMVKLFKHSQIALNPEKDNEFSKLINKRLNRVE